MGDANSFIEGVPAQMHSIPRAIPPTLESNQSLIFQQGYLGSKPENQGLAQALGPGVPDSNTEVYPPTLWTCDCPHCLGVDYWGLIPVQVPYPQPGGTFPWMKCYPLPYIFAFVNLPCLFYHPPSIIWAYPQVSRIPIGRRTKSNDTLKFTSSGGEGISHDTPITINSTSEAYP